MSRRLGLAAAIAVLALANGWLLAAVAYNRAGEPDARVEFSERELTAEASFEGSDEDTGVALTLTPPRQGSTTGPSRARRSWCWSSRARAGAAGWRRGLAQEERALAELRREVASGVKGREELERQERQLGWRRLTATRLVAVDAGRDPARRYPDRARYLVLAGVVELSLWRRQQDDPLALRGWISRLAVERVHVPLRMRPVLDDYMSDYRDWQRAERADPDAIPKTPPPPLRATIAVGRRYEPWLLDVRR